MKYDYFKTEDEALNQVVKYTAAGFHAYYLKFNDEYFEVRSWK